MPISSGNSAALRYLRDKKHPDRAKVLGQKVGFVISKKFKLSV